MLRAEDIAVAVHYVVTQPARCDVTFLQIRPHVENE
jgi:NADP-dependent 3-hydroxy acid dehydrogenase YdfG